MSEQGHPNLLAQQMAGVVKNDPFLGDDVKVHMLQLMAQVLVPPNINALNINVFLSTQLEIFLVASFHERQATAAYDSWYARTYDQVSVQMKAAGDKITIEAVRSRIIVDHEREYQNLDRTKDLYKSIRETAEQRFRVLEQISNNIREENRGDRVAR